MRKPVSTCVCAAIVGVLAGARPVAAQVRVSDTFTGPNGMALTSHAPDVGVAGAPWQFLEGPATPVLYDGAVKLSVTSGPYIVTAIDSGRSDASVSVDVIPGEGSSHGGLILRSSANGQNFFAVWCRNDQVRMLRRENGKWYDVAITPPFAIANGIRHRLEARLSASTIQVYWDGAFQFQHVSSFQQTSTRHGMI